MVFDYQLDGKTSRPGTENFLQRQILRGCVARSCRFIAVKIVNAAVREVTSNAFEIHELEIRVVGESDVVPLAI